MTINEEIRTKQNSIMLGILFLIALLYIIDTGPDDIQPWDEAMYIVRVKSIVNFGDWLDQTNHSVGGLYSASHPPLFIWLTAVSLSVFGENHFSLRLFSVLFSIGILFLLFFFFKDKRIGLIGTLITASIPVYYFYSHQAQLDIPVTFFMLLSIFLFKKHEEEKNKKILLFSGIAWGLAMMTKIAVGLIIPISIVIYSIILIQQKNKKFQEVFQELGIFILTGAIIFLPWHIYMCMTNENFLSYFLNYHILQRITTGVENNVKSLGFFYYVNQSFVFFSGAILFIYFTFKTGLKDRANLLLYSVIFVAFVIISFSSTKLQSYFIMLIPFLSLIIAQGLFAGRNERKGKYILAILSVFLAVWSFSQDFRNGIKLLITNFEVTNIVLWYSISGIILILIFTILTKKYGLKQVIILILLLLIFTGFYNKREPYYSSNIEKISNSFFEDDARNLVYVDFRAMSYTYNPQITYYFRGVDLGWIKNKNFQLIEVDLLEKHSKIEGYSNSNINIKKPGLGKLCIKGEIIKEDSYVIVTSFLIGEIRKIDCFSKKLSDKNLIGKDSSYYYYKIQNIK
ncbi:MAG: glycosyltransferase family 39 protein [bacterium]